MQVKEEYVFTPENFIGIFGGYLGLFLGGSILGIIEYIEIVVTKTCTM